MDKSMMWVLTAGAVASAAGTVSAQVSILVADRAGSKVWTATDTDRNGVIDHSDPVELRAYFDATNASGLSGPGNPSALGFGGGMALIGDQDAAGRRWTWGRDLNGDGDALDDGESGVWADATNAGGFSFGAPSGVAFGPDGQIAMVNASNAFGADDVFLARDDGGGSDGDANDPGELVRWVTVNGFGVSGSFSPQEAAYDKAGTLYLRNSSSNLHGVYRLRDADGSGAIDVESEMTLFFGAGNESGVSVSAGLDLCLDPLHARSFYYWQVATGGNDQLLRIRDVNNDGDAMDQGEAEIAYSTVESGFSAVDSVALADGSVLISDNSGLKVYRLVDNDGDGRFTTAGERVDFVAGGLGAARAISLVHDVGCSAADIGRQGGVLGGDGVLDNNDFVVYIDLFFGDAPLADVGRQGGIAPGDGSWDNNDFVVFIAAFFAGCG
ncbi:MAG TPA: GC-type dockerin domain-anchored protein [Phycisphaerales bacterium]|nr:GC-type dockerin domain-anchored protein [Phycisphaerales bacterium]